MYFWEKNTFFSLSPEVYLLISWQGYPIKLQQPENSLNVSQV